MVTNEYRKKELAELAEYISLEYCSDSMVSPEFIAGQFGITYNYGNYGDYFDGLLEHEAGEFHIYLNNHKPDSNRIRFSFAHELGHYFVDEHRNALIKGKSLHKSYYRLQRKNIVEKEADHFASNLLMPTSRFIRLIEGKKFNFSIIDSLTKEFGTSLSATLIKFIQSGNHPIMVVFSKNNKIENRWISDDFPYKYFQDHYSGNLPPLTAAGDYFNFNEKYNNTEEVDTNEWFSSKEDIRGRKLYEKCIYQNDNRVISILWED